ncbi:DUF3999 family protein [Flavobacterium hydatis]|uniref:DUF3999 family protein n=2 Tax=Flavobacterium hydatis TaxID=991 RepID=A0ABX4CHZ6_FLAHY|nr:DUF3999 family protein [Flavobacterium hydatis]OXA95071.1 hypothetical protein B0A62_09190 [Flavobacterium hydatis]
MKTNPMKLMKPNKFLFLLFLVNFSFAQYNTTAKIKAVTSTGLNKIVLPPAIRSASKEDLSDFRIFDSKGIEVPYFVARNEKETFSNSFEEYSIVSKTVIPNKSSSVIIANPSTKSINQISLFIANSDVVKTYSLSGSNDQKEWFGLSNAQNLSDLNSDDKTNVIKTISFPLSSYQFLKIDFDDKKTLPINILKAGNYTQQVKNNSLQEIIPKSSSLTQLTAEKKTKIHIVFDAPQIIDQITFDISKPEFYKRDVTIYKNATRKVKRKTETYEENITYFELNSDTKNTFNVPQIFEKEIYISIDNQDNPPLGVGEIKFYQIPVSIVTSLNANENYTIKTGNNNLNEPQYDLSNFKNSISANLPEASISEIKQIASADTTIQNKSFWQQSWFMWICIIIGGIAILYFTASLVKDMKKE